METVTENLKPIDKRKFAGFKLSEKTLEWSRELFPSKRFLAIEFDRNLVKFIVVHGPNIREGVRFLKVKFLSSDGDEELGKVLRENLNEMGINRGHHVTISVPRHSVHAKILRLPSHDVKELRKMVLFQMQKELPLPPEDVLCDFRVITREPDGFAQVMAVTARKHEIERYEKLCKSVGLVVDAIRLNIEAIYHSFQQFLKDLGEMESQCVALVDVDFSATNIIIIDRGRFLFCRSVGRGVGELMDGMVGPERALVYDNWTDELSRGVEDTLAIFKRSGVERDVEAIALTGWLPRRKEITLKLSQDLNVPASWFDLMIPMGHFADAGSGDATMHHWFSISTLLGMAGARQQNLMDLRLPEQRRKQRGFELLRQGFRTGLLFLYVLVLVVGTAKIALNRRHVVLENLRSQIESLQPNVKAVNDWQKVQKTLQHQLGSTEPTSALVVQLLTELPAGIELSSLTFMRGQRLVVRGTARSLAEVFNLPQALARQPDFHEAVITSANRRQGSGKNAEIEFEMKINLQREKSDAQKSNP
ncbi:MAG: pilus assembly protein PilM [bacterium]